MFKLFGKLLLFVPIILAMMYVSYRVDPSGLFWGAGFERLASEYMLQGEYINGYERLDGRALNEVYAKNVPYAPQVLINGSSRSLMFNNTFVKGKTFYNTANVGADICDFFNGYYSFSKEGKEPEIMILSVDAWIFSSDLEALDKRSDKDLYHTFLGEELGYTNYDYTPTDPNEKYSALLDPSYFQGSVKYYFKDKSLDVQPEPVPKDKIYLQNEVIKCPDGSIIYDKKFRELTQDQIDFIALNSASNSILRIANFTQLDKNYTKQFEDFIKYLQKKGITVIIYLPPYHPIAYDIAQNRKDYYGGMFLAETYCRELAQKYEIALYGSYSPYALGLTNADFMDDLHIKQASLKKIFPLIE